MLKILKTDYFQLWFIIIKARFYNAKNKFKQKNGNTFDIFLDKGLKGTVVSWALTFLNGGSVKKTLTVSSN